MEAAIPGLIENLLRINIVEAEEIPDDIQHTKERKPDVLKKVLDEQGNIFILHLEIQVADEPDMVYRMADYFIMLHRRYRIPIRQYVIFVGFGLPIMPTQLQEKPMQFMYALITLSAVDYRLFLSSATPEQILLSILADFDNQPAQTVIWQVISRLRETDTGDFSFRRHINQLRVLAQLRKLSNQIDEIMDSIATFFKEEDDALYIRGERVGLQRGEGKAIEKLVTNLILKSKLTVQQISEMAEVSVAYVEEVQQRLKKAE